MGVYQRTDADTYWMPLVIDAERLRQDTGVQDRTVAKEIFAAWQVTLPLKRGLGIQPPNRSTRSKTSYPSTDHSHAAEGRGTVQEDSSPNVAIARSLTLVTSMPPWPVSFSS